MMCAGGGEDVTLRFTAPVMTLVALTFFYLTSFSDPGCVAVPALSWLQSAVQHTPVAQSSVCQNEQFRLRWAPRGLHWSQANAQASGCRMKYKIATKYTAQREMVAARRRRQAAPLRCFSEVNG